MSSDDLMSDSSSETFTVTESEQDMLRATLSKLSCPPEKQDQVVKLFMELMSQKQYDISPEERRILESPPPKPLVSADIPSIAKYIKEGHAKNIIVMCGAGISVSAGIPDFRTPGTGLYYNLQEYNLPDPQDLFSMGYFRENPIPFFKFAKTLYPDQFHPTKTHYFIRLLQEKGLLLRDFTQNIDTLEYFAGIPEEKTVFCHGSFSKSHCIGCKKEYTYEYVRKKVFGSEELSRIEGFVDDARKKVVAIISALAEKKEIDEETKKSVKTDVEMIDQLLDKVLPDCPSAKEALENLKKLVPELEKNSEQIKDSLILISRRLDNLHICTCDVCGAYVKPDIVFFGEMLPPEFFLRMNEDFPKCDLLIVMGTSLKVQPFAGLISQVPEDCPRVLINREVVATKPAPPPADAPERERYNYRVSSKFAFSDPENRRDVLFHGDCDSGVEALAEALGWSKELQELCEAPVSAGPSFL